MLPFFRIGSEVIYTYPLILGMLTALFYEKTKVLIKNDKSININHNWFLLGLFLSAWFGAKVLFLISANPHLASRAFSSTNFWLGGGFVFYGGLIAALIYLFIYSKLKDISFQSFSFLILPLTLTHGLGRVGCFMAGCCYGRECDLFWSVSLHGKNRHPVQLYEAISLMILYFILRKRYRNKQPLIFFYLISYGTLRFILEFFRGDKIRGIYAMGLSTSQLLSILLLLCALAVLFYPKRHR